MKTTIDTNLLVYARREDSPWHDPPLAKITELAEAKSQQRQETSS